VAVSIHTRLFHSCRGIGGGARKGPKLEALRIDLGKVRQTLHYPNWVSVKPRLAIAEMLSHVEGNVTFDGVDH
jgi:hypothetical protein